MGARLMDRFLGPEYGNLVRGHSRTYAAEISLPLSKLCWADKLAHAYDPPWWYLLRARATGEIWEYRAEAAAAGHVPATATDREWYFWLVGHLVKTTRAQFSTPGSYFPKHVEEV